MIAIRSRRIDGHNKLIAGLTFSAYYKSIPELSHKKKLYSAWQFGNLPGEYSEPPYYLRFGDLNELLYLLDTSENVRQCWLDAAVAEVNRAKASPFRKFHRPLAYDAVMDIDFRAKVLDAAYPESTPTLGLLPEEVDNSSDFHEGAVKQILVNAYERNAQARNKCLDHYGVKCSVCGMAFEKVYGSVGKGFIHVHHMKPLGEIGTSYTIDPINDLCPVCPNCHAMIHMRKPAYNIEDVKAMLQQKKA